MEATSVYHRALARYVSSLGMETKVINPIITGWHKKNIRKTKTDSEDASNIASVYFAGLCLAQWHMEDPSQGLRSLTRDIDREGEALTKLKVMLRQEIRRSFPECEGESKNARFFSPPALFGMYRGFGFTGYLSARFAVDLGDISRFDNEKQLVAWCGLDPSIRQSESSVNAKGCISKRGSRTVRKVFYLASFDYISHPGKSKDFADLEAYYRKKRRDGKHHYVAAVACSTKLLRRFYYRYKDLLKETRIIPNSRKPCNARDFKRAQKRGGNQKRKNLD